MRRLALDTDCTVSLLAQPGTHIAPNTHPPKSTMLGTRPLFWFEAVSWFSENNTSPGPLESRMVTPPGGVAQADMSAPTSMSALSPIGNRTCQCTGGTTQLPAKRTGNAKMFFRRIDQKYTGSYTVLDSRHDRKQGGRDTGQLTTHFW